ncbi:MAG: membrane protein insertase YidC [Bacteroidetes bacterium]|nr:membrane protein insertase YidC [Bacteroidota bacterium]
MDRNTIIGLILIAGIVLTWTFFFSSDGEQKPLPQPKSPTETSATGASSADTAAGTVAAVPMGMDTAAFNALSDSAKDAAIATEKSREHGVFANLYEGEDKVFEVETDKYKIGIHTKGGRIGALQLKEFQTADSMILPIQTDREFNGLSVNFMQAANVKYPNVSTSDLYFTPTSTTTKLVVTGDSKDSISFRAAVDETHFIEYVYVFKGNAYDYGLRIKQSGMETIAQKKQMSVNWQAEIPKTEKTMELMREKTSLFYRESGSVEDLGATSQPEAPVEAENRVDWIAFHSQFFTHTLMTEKDGGSLDNAKVFHANPIPPDPANENSGDVVKLMNAQFDIPIATIPNGSVNFQFYAGPLDFKILKTYDRDMIKQIALGWGPLQYVNRWLTIPIFNFLEGFIGSYGLIILLLGLIIKTLIYPLTYRTYISTAKMRVVNNTPEVKELDLKFKDDPTKLQQAKMAIYRKYGVSMFGGCWPMLVQYPFLIALFFFFPNAIELRQQSFLWAPDLSTYDSIWDLGFNIPMYGDHVSLFTLLMTASIFGYTIINQRMQPQQTANPVMKWFPYIMPIFLLAFLNRYSAGLSWYYFLSNLISISQTIITKYFVSDEKLMDSLREKAKKIEADPNKKKGTLERWAAKQQEKQRDIAASRAEGRGEGKSQGAKTTPPKKRR